MPGPFLAFVGFVIFGALAFWEYLAIHNLDDWAKYLGLRVLSRHGILPENHSGILAAPSGFKVRPLDPDSYLIRTLEWNEHGPGAGVLMPWAFAVVRLHRRQWALEARFGVGIVLFFIAGVGVLLWRAAMDHFMLLGWIASVAWSVLVFVTFVVQARRVRRVFLKFTASLC